MPYFKEKFSNDYYVYDIESTKYELNEDTPIMAYSYLHGIKKYTFNVDMTKDNINEYSDPYIYRRTNYDMQQLFIDINNKAEKDGVKILIFVHNLTYEFYNSIFNMPLLNKLLEEDSTRVFAISSTKILNIKVGNLVFMDSLILFGKGLKTCASEVGMVKNEEHKTYNEVWTEVSELPQWEYDYNEHDLDLVAVYFSKFIKLLNLKENNITEFINTRVMTSTGMVKYVCKKVNTKEALDIQRRITVETQNSIEPEVQKWIENYVFKGGVCISVPVNTFCINDNVHSIDFASAYPGDMVTGVFPKGKLIKTNGERLIELNNLMSAPDFTYKYFWNRNRIYQPYKMFLFKIRVKDIRIKEFDNKNEIMYLSRAKCEEVNSDSFIVNGRIIYGKDVVISGTEMDFILMKLFYDFTIEDIIEEYIPTKVGLLSEYKILSISKFAVEKEAFKRLEKCANNYNDFINKCNDILVDDMTYGDVFKETNVTIDENNMEHIKDVCHSYLMNAKAKLNAQYGISVQHQFQQSITYNNYQFDINDDEKLNWNKNENYLQGIYVTAHTRFRLLLMARHLIDNDFNIVYFDTDSIKVMGDKDKLFNIINEWNDMIGFLRMRLKRRYKNSNLFLSNFGNFDYEGTYDYFITHGSKRYITVEGDEVHCTISGVNKKANSGGATLFYRKYGLQDLYKYWCGLNTLYDYTLCKRSINFIPKEPMLIDDDIVDDNNKVCHIHQYSCEGISEKDCGYLLSSYNKPLDNLIRWFYYCKSIGGNSNIYEPYLKPHSIIVDNAEYNEDGLLINGDVRVEEGYVIEKYAEKMFSKWSKYFSNNKTMDYNDDIYKVNHNFNNGVIFTNDIS